MTTSFNSNQTAPNPSANQVLVSDGVNNQWKTVVPQTAVNTNATAGGVTSINVSNGNVQNIVMGSGDTTLSISGAVTNQMFVVTITQDSVGSRLVTWFSTIRWAGGVAPVLTLTANKRDMFGFICTGTGTYDGLVLGLNI